MRVNRGPAHKKREEPGEGRAAGAGLEHTARTGADRMVVCKSCGHDIARASDRIDMAGRHEHTCVNPHGYVYRIGCYRQAAGCAGVGEWSDHHSWFAGAWWQVACCGRCSIHLGWAFTGDQPDFVGLIVERVEERGAP